MFALIIVDDDKSNIFEDMNNCFPYTALVSKTVRNCSFLLGLNEVELSEFWDMTLFC